MTGSPGRGPRTGLSRRARRCPSPRRAALPFRPRERAIQVRHLLPQGHEIVGMPALPAAGAGEPPLVRPPAISADHAGRPEVLGATLDLSRSGRDHLAAGGAVMLQN